MVIDHSIHCSLAESHGNVVGRDGSSSNEGKRIQTFEGNNNQWINRKSIFYTLSYVISI